MNNTTQEDGTPIDAHQIAREFIKENAPAEFQNTSLDEIPDSVFNNEQIEEKNRILALFY